jgi:hypothetical protein
MTISPQNKSKTWSINFQQTYFYKEIAKNESKRKNKSKSS